MDNSNHILGSTYISHWQFLLVVVKTVVPTPTWEPWKNVMNYSFLLSLSQYHDCHMPKHAQLRSPATAVRRRLIKRSNCSIGTEAILFVPVSRCSHQATITHWRYSSVLSGVSKTVNEYDWASQSSDTSVGEYQQVPLGTNSCGGWTEVLKCSKLQPSSAGEISVRHGARLCFVNSTHL